MGYVIYFTGTDQEDVRKLAESITKLCGVNAIHYHLTSSLTKFDEERIVSSKQSMRYVCITGFPYSKEDVSSAKREGLLDDALCIALGTLSDAQYELKPNCTTVHLRIQCDIAELLGPVQTIIRVHSFRMTEQDPTPTLQHDSSRRLGKIQRARTLALSLGK